MGGAEKCALTLLSLHLEAPSRVCWRWKWKTLTRTAKPGPGPGVHQPVVDLRALLQARQQAHQEGLEAGQEQLLQWEEVPLIQAKQHGPHRHGGIGQEGKQAAALRDKKDR